MIPGISENDLPFERVTTDALWRLRASRPGARDELVRRNLHLARALAARYRNANEPLDDLIQVASLGLLKAVDRFDPDFGRSFSTYAIPTILGELRRHFRDTGWSVHVPRGTQEMALRVQRAISELTEKRGRSPSVPDVAAYLELEPELVLEALEAGQAHFATSLDAPVAGAGDDSEPTTLLEQTGADDAAFSLIETSSSLVAGIARLPSLERDALVLRLDRGMTQSEIARELGCSQMQISRLLRRAAQRLRDEFVT